MSVNVLRIISIVVSFKKVGQCTQNCQHSRQTASRQFAIHFPNLLVAHLNTRHTPCVIQHQSLDHLLGALCVDSGPASRVTLVRDPVNQKVSHCYSFRAYILAVKDIHTSIYTHTHTRMYARTHARTHTYNLQKIIIIFLLIFT